jgi:hypothetical protein
VLYKDTGIFDQGNIDIMKQIKLLIVVLTLGGLLWGETASADSQPMKPFVLASAAPGDLSGIAAETTAKLKLQGLEIVGSYRPYPTAVIIAVTTDALKKVAAASRYGGYGAAMRVSVTDIDSQIQVAYTNPAYMAGAYKMSDDLNEVNSKLVLALGQGKPFGPEHGMNKEELGDYHYMFGMEYFDDQTLLNKFVDHKSAVDTVEKNLARGVMGITKVYRIDIPGTEDVIFGVAMNGKKGGGDDQDDTFIMNEIDFKDIRSTAHLPYEILVSGDKALALSARFRIAINFPDLAMMGPNSFMNIMGAPDAINKALSSVANPHF